MTDDDVTATDPVWPELEAWIAEAGNLVDLVPAEDEVGEATLRSLDGVDETSALGALARNAAAMVIDDWLLVLGAGGGEIPGLRELNGRAIEGVEAIPGALVVAVDRLGGAFAVNAGGLPEGEIGELAYLAPDDLEWMACGFGHAEFIEWVLEGDVEGFYADVRWDQWREEAATLRPSQGFTTFPPPWVDPQGQVEIRRSSSPLVDLWKLVLATSLTQGTWAPAGNG